MPKTKQSTTRGKKVQQNGQPDADRIESLKQQFLSLKSGAARAAFIKPLSAEERRPLLLLQLRMFRSDSGRVRFLRRLSSAELHTLMWDMTYESHQQGRRLA
ncbi:MAG: hypothetical protein ACREEM_02015 [Blastocatellia bacterium]